MNDDFSYIDGMFDDLTPEQFIQGVRARETKTGAFVGEHAWQAFVDKSVAKARKIYAKKPSKYEAFQPVAIFCALATPATKLIYEPESGDTIGMFLDRLREDAKLMHATWFFFAMKTVVGVHYASGEEEEPDIASPQAMADVVENGMMGEGILWHASRHEGDRVQHRNGILTIVQNEIVEAIEGSETQTIEAFSSVLP